MAGGSAVGRWWWVGSHRMVPNGCRPQGWGATCKEHENESDVAYKCCKKQFRGYGLGMDDAECIRRMKQWLYEGTKSVWMTQARTKHLKIHPKDLILMDEADLDAKVAALDPL